MIMSGKKLAGIFMNTKAKVLIYRNYFFVLPQMN